MRSKGKFLFKQQWWSICSRHYVYDKECNICNAGHWEYTWVTKFNHLFFKISPRLWRWYMNRPNSKARQRIEKWFPNMKKK